MKCAYPTFSTIKKVKPAKTRKFYPKIHFSNPYFLLTYMCIYVCVDLHGIFLKFRNAILSGIYV